MARFLIRWLIIAVALYAAVAIVPGISPQPGTDWMSFLWLAAIFGVVNALLGPLLKFMTCLLNILTLGLFTLVINTFLFWLSGEIGTRFGVGFTVDNFLSALFGSLIVSLVSIVLNTLIRDDRKPHKA